MNLEIKNINDSIKSLDKFTLKLEQVNSKIADFLSFTSDMFGSIASNNETVYKNSISLIIRGFKELQKEHIVLSKLTQNCQTSIKDLSTKVDLFVNNSIVHVNEKLAETTQQVKENESSIWDWIFGFMNAIGFLSAVKTLWSKKWDEIFAITKQKLGPIFSFMGNLGKSILSAASKLKNLQAALTGLRILGAAGIIIGITLALTNRSSPKYLDNPENQAVVDEAELRSKALDVLNKQFKVNYTSEKLKGNKNLPFDEEDIKLTMGFIKTEGKYERKSNEPDLQNFQPEDNFKNLDNIFQNSLSGFNNSGFKKEF